MIHASIPWSRVPARLAFLALLLLAACRAPTAARDATVEIHTPGTGELGAATDYGIVFLGHGQQSGSVTFDAWFGEDPSRESGVIEAVGGGLYTTEAEIQLPIVPLTFEVPEDGSEVVVLSRSGRVRQRAMAVVASHPAVQGVLLRLRPGARVLTPDQIGAGVYIERGGRMSLLGLVSGCVSLPDADGVMEEFLAVMGPDQTWQVVTNVRNWSRTRRWVYREDIL